MNKAFKRIYKYYDSGLYVGYCRNPSRTYREWALAQPTKVQKKLFGDFFGVPMVDSKAFALHGYTGGLNVNNKAHDIPLFKPYPKL